MSSRKPSKEQYQVWLFFVEDLGSMKARIKLIFFRAQNWYSLGLTQFLSIFLENWHKGDFLEWQDLWRKFLIWRDIGKTVEVWETEIALGTLGTKAYHPKSTQYYPRSTHKYSISSQINRRLYSQFVNLTPFPYLITNFESNLNHALSRQTRTTSKASIFRIRRFG